MTTITETNGLDFGVCVQNPLSFLLLKFQQENCHIVGFCILKHLNPLVWMMSIYTDILLSYIRFTQSHMGSCLTCQQYLPGYSRWANSAKAWIPWACHRTEKPAPLWTSLFHLCYPLSNPPSRVTPAWRAKETWRFLARRHVSQTGRRGTGWHTSFWRRQGLPRGGSTKVQGIWGEWCSEDRKVGTLKLGRPFSHILWHCLVF